MIIKETRVKEYITPIRIVETNGDIKNSEVLTKIFERQNFFKTDLCTVKGKGYIVLDFGKEIYGTIRIQTNRFSDEKKNNNFRIRFGESLTEACCELGEKGSTNDHSTRDMEIYMSSNSDMEWGSTGFRFVRIDFLVEQTYRISGIAAGFIHQDIEKKGEFDGDGRLKEIYDTAAYTLFLNMQNSIWDGIKRDQHIWVGDLYPEILGIMLSYGNVPIVEESLLNIVSHYKLPVWYNDIPTYNIWFILCVNDYVKYSGKYNPLLISALEQNIDLFDRCVTENGEMDFKGQNLYFWVDDFFEWPCFGTEDSKIGIFYLLKYALKKIAEEKLFDEKIIIKAENVYKRIKHTHYPFTKVKSIEALRVLCGENVSEGLRTIEYGGAKGCSVFFMYFILKALAENGKGKVALKIAEDYYGAMLDCGATTFWENFDIEWVKDSCRIDEFPTDGRKDIHGDFGANCYTGFRHSLCHGWSCGIIAFLVEDILGIEVKRAGFEAVQINPMQDITSAKGVIPTPFGDMKVNANVDKNGAIMLNLVKPKNIEIVS
ncbi:MAG: hypothetical protein IJQ07_05905 [Clostridia bacterium]|nr:hypothetical protein [Clostridia bacterium]